MKKNLRLAFLALSLAALTVFSVGCQKNASKKYGDKPVAKIEMEDGRTITFEMYPEIAPKSVEFVIELIEEKYYDGKVFHRAVKDFMIQGGSSDGSGMGGSGRTVKGEFAENGFENTLKHEPGVVSLARSSDPDSASGQFFICQGKASTHLDGKYAAFGKVTEGMDVVDEIAAMKKTGAQKDQLVEKPVIKSITMVKS